MQFNPNDLFLSKLEGGSLSCLEKPIASPMAFRLVIHDLWPSVMAFWGLGMKRNETGNDFSP